jgi:hypothetical protein
MRYIDISSLCNKYEAVDEIVIHVLRDFTIATQV